MAIQNSDSQTFELFENGFIYFAIFGPGWSGTHKVGSVFAENRPFTKLTAFLVIGAYKLPFCREIIDNVFVGCAEGYFSGNKGFSRWELVPNEDWKTLSFVTNQSCMPPFGITVFECFSCCPIRKCCCCLGLSTHKLYFLKRQGCATIELIHGNYEKINEER